MSFFQSPPLICAVFLCVLICNVLSAEINVTKRSFDSEHIEHASKEKKWKPKFVPGDSPDHLMWFVQVSIV